ncbi:hypothetical protein ABL78_0166 [Leptomonas seymouri]|uniref:Uncharacterized protein n=1 Tax=Leptomonas seymouri TaxID=5684 RepID=A0A0N1ICF8_LEPSE|nr:hypothetical protein ABL78_0166 [Leptomonas seymouri]|eukprot:KPI90730.1 hypothetical protein ABL78_0166 [Leptomonas seymouri]
MPVKAGDVVKVSFTNKGDCAPSAVIGVVEAVDATQELATVFVGNKRSWSVPTSSITPIGLPASCSWTAEDTQKVQSTAAAFLTTAAGQQPLPFSFSSSPRHYEAQEAAAAVLSKSDGAVGHACVSMHTASSSSVRNLDSYDFEPTASYTNVLYEINARLTGLCTWSSPPLTALFLTVLYLWLAVEGSGLPFLRSDAPLLSAISVVQRCVLAAVRTLLAVVLCTCISMAPRQVPTSTFWLMFPLVVASLSGLIPDRWWHTLAVGCFPIGLTSRASASGGAAPLLLWVGKTALDGGRCVLRAFSTAISSGEALFAVSEDRAK